jgi:hypothetical protein
VSARSQRRVPDFFPSAPTVSLAWNSVVRPSSTTVTLGRSPSLTPTTFAGRSTVAPCDSAQARSPADGGARTRSLATHRARSPHTALHPRGVRPHRSPAQVASRRRPDREPRRGRPATPRSDPKARSGRPECGPGTRSPSPPPAHRNRNAPARPRASTLLARRRRSRRRKLERPYLIQSDAGPQSTLSEIRAYLSGPRQAAGAAAGPAGSLRRELDTGIFRSASSLRPPAS